MVTMWILSLFQTTVTLEWEHNSQICLFFIDTAKEECTGSFAFGSEWGKIWRENNRVDHHSWPVREPNANSATHSEMTLQTRMLFNKLTRFTASNSLWRARVLPKFQKRNSGDEHAEDFPQDGPGTQHLWDTRSIHSPCRRHCVPHRVGHSNLHVLLVRKRRRWSRTRNKIKCKKRGKNTKLANRWCSDYLVFFFLHLFAS